MKPPVPRRPKTRTGTARSSTNVLVIITCGMAAAVATWHSIRIAATVTKTQAPSGFIIDNAIKTAQSVPWNSFKRQVQDETASMKERHVQNGEVATILRDWAVLEERGANFTQDDMDFINRVRALDNLREGWPAVPPRGDQAPAQRRNWTTQGDGQGRRPAGSLLYCMKYCLASKTCGYTTRPHSVIRGFVTAGWDVRAVTAPVPSKSDPPPGGHRLEVVDSVTYHVGEGLWSKIGPGLPMDVFLMGIADHFMREAAAGNANIIVAASNFGNALPALMAARRMGLPFIYEVRGLWELTRASLMPQWADSDHFHIMVALEAQAAREADLVATLTTELADELVRRGVDRDRIVLVPNAADLNIFASRPLPAEDTPIRKHLNLSQSEEPAVIGFAGSATAYEGLELLIDALAELTRRGISYTFLLLGEGNAIVKVKARAEVRGINAFCRFPGRVPFDQVQDFMALMDVVVIPRLSLPVTEVVSALKPLEAMAMGKALVLSDVSPHRIMAGHGAEPRAWLFPPGSVQGLAAALEGLLGNETERARLGRAGRAWIENERNWKAVTAEYSEALLTVLDQAYAHQWVEERKQ